MSFCFFVILPELVCSVLSLISEPIPNTLVLVFVFIGVCKVICKIRYDLDSRSQLLIIAVSALYDTSLLIGYLTGLQNSITSLTKDAVCIAIGIIMSWTLGKLLYNEHIKRISPNILSLLTVGAVLLSCGAVCAAAFIFKVISNRGDGSVDIAGISIQLPEILKIELVVTAYITGLLIRYRRRYIFTFYFSSAVVLFVLAVALKEGGTTLLTIYFTLAVSLILTLSGNTKHSIAFIGAPVPDIIGNIISSPLVPLLGTVTFFGVLGIVKRVLYTLYPVRGAKGEELYGLGNRAFSISSRLSADSAQIERAKDIFDSAPPVQVNLNNEVCIPNAELKTVLADYSFVVAGSALGRVVAEALFVFAVIALTYAAFRRKEDMLAKASAVMLLLQALVHVSGILFSFCYTGVNFPFLSVGGSSLVSSVTIAGLILISLRRSSYENT